MQNDGIWTHQHPWKHPRMVLGLELGRFGTHWRSWRLDYCSRWLLATYLSFDFSFSQKRMLAFCAGGLGTATSHPTHSDARRKVVDIWMLTVWATYHTRSWFDFFISWRLGLYCYQSVDGSSTCWVAALFVFTMNKGLLTLHSITLRINSLL